MNKTIHFIAGMPRSGSTLLANVLAQNPRFEATATSGILDAIFIIRHAWDQIVEFKTAPNESAKVNVMRAMLHGYFADSDRPVAFDKGRGWLAHLELAERLLGRNAKVLVPVRDLRDILASFEKLWRAASAVGQIQQEHDHYGDFQSIEGRSALWLRQDQPVGLTYARIKDAIHRGFRDRLHFVHYERLTSNPRETLDAIYDFLEEPRFAHDFDHVEQLTREDDAIYRMPDLHVIRAKVQPQPSQARQLLGGPLVEKYKGPYIWDVL